MVTASVCRLGVVKLLTFFMLTLPAQCLQHLDKHCCATKSQKHAGFIVVLILYNSLDDWERNNMAVRWMGKGPCFLLFFLKFTTVWDDQQVANSFKFAIIANWTQDFTGMWILWSVLTSPWPLMLTYIQVRFSIQPKGTHSVWYQLMSYLSILSFM